MSGTKGEGRETKADKRIQATAARKAAETLAERRRRTTRMITAGSIVLVVVVGIVFSLIANHNKADTSKVALPPSAVVANSSGLTFNAKASPLIDVWEDLQCPACGIFEKANGQYLHDVVAQGRAKVVFHILSFLGPESTLLANAAGCADKEGKFLDFHTYMYAHQKTENSGYWNATTIIAAGKDLGITDSAFASCVSDNTYAKWVQNIEASGSTQNINQTPTVLINGKEVSREAGTYIDAKIFKAALASAGVK